MAITRSTCQRALRFAITNRRYSLASAFDTGPLGRDCTWKHKQNRLKQTFSSSSSFCTGIYFCAWLYFLDDRFNFGRVRQLHDMQLRWENRPQIQDTRLGQQRNGNCELLKQPTSESPITTTTTTTSPENHCPWCLTNVNTHTLNGCWYYFQTTQSPLRCFRASTSATSWRNFRIIFAPTNTTAAWTTNTLALTCLLSAESEQYFFFSSKDVKFHQNPFLQHHTSCTHTNAYTQSLDTHTSVFFTTPLTQRNSELLGNFSFPRAALIWP